MPEVNARLEQIGALVKTEMPFQRLTGTVYLDAQAVIQWIRLNVFEEVLDLLPIGSNYLRRFRMQDAPYNETLGVLVKKFNLGSYAKVAAYLKSHPNLQIDRPLEASSPVGQRALALRQQMCIQVGEDPAVNVKGHLGEAETLAMIDHHEPGAVFVTADKGAVAVAKDTGAAHIVRPSAFIAGTLKSRDEVTELWKHTCLARLCRHPDAWDLDCVAALECVAPTPEAETRSPISPNHVKVTDTLAWIHDDLKVLISVLQAKGA